LTVVRNKALAKVLNLQYKSIVDWHCKYHKIIFLLLFI